MWIEVRSGLRRSGQPKLVPLQDAHLFRGFRSVFGFPQQVAEIIQIQGGTQGLRGFDVYCDTIFMDFDKGDPVEFKALLRSEGIAHQEFFSGGRSTHLHIPLAEPICGPWVPNAVKQWTKQHAPDADVSFLNPSGMYRLAGTFHSKYPGQCKALLYEQDGQRISLQEPQTKSYMAIVRDEEVSEEILYAELMSKKGAGGRSTQIWKIATIAGQLGKSEEEAMELLHFWNSHNALPPHNEDVLVTQLNSAYRRLRRMG